MNRLLTASIDRFGPVQNDVRDSLSDCSQSVLQVPAGQAIVEIAAPSRFRVLARGMAVRQHVLADGGRQILGFATPGDLLDLSGLFTGVDHEVRALGDCEIRQTTTREVSTLIRRHPNLLAALCRAVMTEARLQRNWMVGLGRRTAVARTANLFCEIYARQKVVALAHDGRCHFPALQSDIADALGLSAVHTHRILRTLKMTGLATLHGGQLTILDWNGLVALAEFDPACFRPLSDAAAVAAARLKPPTQAQA
ncbi:Crp/Fnr family transcriptional regulator [Caulobacter sp. DWR1-3-2b1]|uniref:Crp/Fnr family transcriptional regulator n=1 Tax=Caulobacter sp. DWR1-3-2b1 TaxID=2804670 RepID=UPI003CFA33E1